MLTWQDAEHLAGAAMQAMGFQRVQITPPTRDGGVDVIATGAVAQVKLLSNPVQRPDIQRLRGAAYRTQNALFFSFSGYTSGAIEYADQNAVALFNMVGSAPMAVNAVARNLLVHQAAAIRPPRRSPERRGKLRAAGRAVRRAAVWAKKHWRVTVPVGAGLLASSLFYGIAQAADGPWPNDESPNWVTITGISIWTLVGLATHGVIRWLLPADGSACDPPRSVSGEGEPAAS